ncbi:MAG: murein biosynthesis integral membrane protein MurJ [Paraclostridium sordellii]
MSNVAKATIGLMVATILSKILGFARSVVLASSYGAGIYSDAYLIAMNIPLVIVASIGAAITTTFIPVYSSVDSNLGEKEALKFTNNILNIVLLFSLLLTIIGIVFVEPLVKLFAFGLGEKAFKIAVKFTRILLISLLFSGISFVITAYLQVKGKFTITGLITIPRNLIIIISTILSVKFGPYVMVWGTLIGLATDVLFMVPYAATNGYTYGSYINLKDKNFKKTMYLLGPIFIGVAVNQLNTMIDRALASTLAEGSISALNYANKLNVFVMALFISSISVVVYPMLSKLSNKSDKDEFIKVVVQSINSIILLIIPISVGAIMLAKPIVKILFQRGAFDERATTMTAISLIMYSLGMIAFGLREVLGKIFYSLQDTKTPMKNGIIAVILNIILNIILVNYMKYAGLALATSISAMLCILLLFNSLRKKIGYFGQDCIIKTTLKSLISAIVMGIVTYSIYMYLGSILNKGFIEEFIVLFCSVIIGAITYAIVSLLLKIEEVQIISIAIKDKFNKNRSNKLENN